MANHRGACVNRFRTQLEALAQVLIDNRNKLFSPSELMNSIGSDHLPNGNKRIRKLFRKLHRKRLARGVFDHYRKPRLVGVRFNKTKWVGYTRSEIVRLTRGSVKVPRGYDDTVEGTFIPKASNKETK